MGAVKAIVAPNPAKMQYLPTKFINLNNVNDADVKPYLNGLTF